MPNDHWKVSYATVNFFEKILKNHDKVEDFKRKSLNQFVITKKNYDKREKIVVILVNRYTLGQADIFQAIEEFGEFDCIVTSADWNGYTQEAKQWGLQNSKGVFTVGEFSGCLNYERYWEYVKKDEKGKPMYNYKSE
ncbi:MAG: hypothetical protein PHR82_07360 [Endomicrobiaceae bacterium]|nr:hypothetical protein [Endomicrobiaceae bacterium]